MLEPLGMKECRVTTISGYLAMPGRTASHNHGTVGPSRGRYGVQCTSVRALLGAEREQKHDYHEPLGVWRLAVSPRIHHPRSHRASVRHPCHLCNLALKLRPSHAPRWAEYSVMYSAGLHLFCSGNLGYRLLANQSRLRKWSSAALVPVTAPTRAPSF